jgi:DNA invertase Pin-like site-specific DNA recombinase
MKYFIYCRKSQEAEDRQVMSLQSQQDEINRLIANNPDLEIAGIYTEAFSAKQPGRPQFNDMMSRIERREAEGIIAWHPDRLARNSMDGGRIIFALDQGQLKDMRFCSYSFENDPQGKFMLNIVFGYSKYQVDTLSVNVKRGLKTKLKNGWKPNLAPIGYKNCKETKTIIPDKTHFKAIKGMFDLMLTGEHTPSTIHRIVCNEWGYTTPQRKRMGGTKPSLSTIYKLLSNPFYAGFIRWKGQLYTGSHIPLLSKSQFEQVQKRLGQTQPTKNHKRNFPYIGVMRCGACGLSITAETKTKPSGKQYTYYQTQKPQVSATCN